MPLRLRKFIGAILLITLVVSWALVAMALAQAPAIKANGLIEVIYYVVAGLAWVLPAMPLVRWMSRPDAASRRRRAAESPGSAPRMSTDSRLPGHPCAGCGASVEVPALAERSAARLAHQSGGLGVPSSNLGAPTNTAAPNL